MDDEMIECVTKIICETLFGLHSPSGQAKIAATEAIKAMREPTEKMMVAAENAYPTLLTFADKEESGAYIAYRAMIDAIINE